jgi:cytochrome c oxidase subunit 2
VDAAFVEPANPLGMNPDDPNGHDDVLVTHPVLHLPVDRPVKFLLRSLDVLHNFTVPQFRVKMDFVPGTVTYIWATPKRTGSFDLLCEELCGVGHYAMRGSVVVDTAADYSDWMARQKTFSQTRAESAGDASLGAASYAVCAACHGTQAEGNAAMHAPRLAGQDAWYLRRQLENFRQGTRGAHEADTWGKTMVPMAMTLPDAAAVNNVVAYIGTLPVVKSTGTQQGAAARARGIYESTCSNCHGQDGSGNWATNAPALRGMDDWYLAQQLHNFRQGIRGRHPQDLYGLQMALFANTLPDEAAIADMAAYLHGL